MSSRRGRNAGSLSAIQPPPNPAAVGNLRSVKHGAYSGRLKAGRVREVLDELLVEHPHEGQERIFGSPILEDYFGPHSCSQ